MKIITLIENIVYKTGLKAEHGLSFLIKTATHHILFDAGQTDEFLVNASKMGENLLLVDIVILSHGHYDHAGGLEAFLKFNTHALVYLKQEAFQNKYSSSTGNIRPIGIPFDTTPYQHRFRYVTNHLEIAPDIVLLGDIIKHATYETENSKLLTQKDETYTTDSFDDELVMYIKHTDGLVIVSGCAHRGLINTIISVTSHSGVHHIRLFIGGTHLNGTPRHRLMATTQALNRFDIKQLMCNHCTGIQAYSHLEKKLVSADEICHNRNHRYDLTINIQLDGIVVSLKTD